MQMTQAKGEFKVELTPIECAFQAVKGLQQGRMKISKTFSGELAGQSQGEMLSCMTGTKGSAGYVAIEHISATLHGKTGSFAVQHFGLMNRGEQRQLLEIIPDSGAGDLTGIKGQMRIEIENGRHFYHLNYQL